MAGTADQFGSGRQIRVSVSDEGQVFTREQSIYRRLQIN
ncbi:hypothetical protein LZ3411_2177 [Levilactobacillus zymae]|uniref:Uncharacterized protein n=1 Tax=Levilactobacillus zymae TaxID=267363 RepID=A0A1Y6JZ69_9LACO|nr:hypothetical protein LZ3411_2177 [Levilactobacillus zymae]